MSANPQRGEVDIVLDKPRIIRLTTNAIARAEELIGTSLLNDNPKSFGFREARALLFVGLNDKSLTLEKVGELMDAADDATVLIAIMKAWNLHLGRHNKAEGQEAESDPQKASSPGPGTNS